LIYDAFPDSLVEVWMLNADEHIETDWLDNFRQEYGLHLPIMGEAQEAFAKFRLGREYRTLPPLYILIDKQGVVRLRSLRQGSISLEEVVTMVEELLEE